MPPESNSELLSRIGRESAKLLTRDKRKAYEYLRLHLMKNMGDLICSGAITLKDLLMSFEKLDEMLGGAAVSDQEEATDVWQRILNGNAETNSGVPNGK